MARATKGTRVLKRVTKKTVPTVNLELSEGEADYLQAVLCKISGHAEKSPQKYGNSIAKALKHATGQDFDETDAYKLMSRPTLTMGIHFRNYPEPKKIKGPLPESDWRKAGHAFANTGYIAPRQSQAGFRVYDELGPASAKSDYWPIDGQSRKDPGYR